LLIYFALKEATILFEFKPYLVELRSKPTIEKELDLSTVPQPPSNASQTMNRGGFTVAPGQRIPQSLSVIFGGGLIFYYLIFSAAQGVVE